MTAVAAEAASIEDTGHQRVTLSIAAGAGLASFAMNFWWPFLPLYLQQIGATSDANALFWVGVATTVQGIARLVSGPFWGVLADRYSRKLMYVRALYAATLTTIIAAFATEPWHIAVALGAQGLFSGFIPAAIALTSVSVPEKRLNNSLGTVTGGQYLGSTLGPMAGALLATAFDYRTAIVAGALLPAVAATWALIAVPRDTVAPRTVREPGTPRFRLSMGSWERPFYVAVVIYFALFALNQLVRVATPIALEDIGGEGAAKAASGVAFTLAGAASVVGVLVLGRVGAERLGLKSLLVAMALVSAGAHLLLAFAGVVPVYLVGFTVISLLNGACMPASNTLIASSVEPARRGTAFGMAGSAQALAFRVGPMSAAFFAVHSLTLGFVVAGAAFALLALVVQMGVRREVAPEEPVAATSGRTAS